MKETDQLGDPGSGIINVGTKFSYGAVEALSVPVNGLYLSE